MTNEPQSVEQLLDATLRVLPKQRSGFVDHNQSSVPGLTVPVSLEGLPRFRSGELIANRFHVVRFIARGGMGEVYEVRDRFLQGTPVALKIIRPQIAADPLSSRRFEQEVLLARSIHHRNLCPIYEIFHCEVPAPSFLFFTMKLLAGESLQASLKRQEVPLQHGVQICTQLVEGIAAIHDAGIIHRDIKPSNVMLEPHGPGVCATIMDFGLARLSEAGMTISRVGEIAGTPGYLAPELIRGFSPTPASDLYALGIVMHQILTGHQPSVSKSGRAEANISALEMSKAPPALVNAIPQLLSGDPEQRCCAFTQIVNHKSYTDEPRKSLVVTRRAFTVGIITALCGVAGGSVWKREQIYGLFHPLPKRRFVALLNWPASDVKITPMVLGLIDTMVSVLSRAEALDHDFFVACQGSLTEMKTPQQVNDVCESLGANLILATSGSLSANGILLSLKVITKDTSQVLRSRSLRTSAKDTFTMSALATHAAAQLLDVVPLPQSVFVNPPETKNSEALAAYQAAEALLKQPNYSGVEAAIVQFTAAVAADPRFANAHARLSIAYLQRFAVFHDAASLLLARANAETAIALDPESVEGHSALGAVYEVTGDLPQALGEIAKALAHDPSDSRIAVYQAQTYFAAKRWQDAEECFKRVLKVRPNYWLAYNELANTYSYQGKYKLAIEKYQAAAITGPRNVLPIVGTALMLFFLDDLDGADAAVSKSLSLSPQSIALQIRANVMLVRNKLTDSLRAALQATEMDPKDSTAWLSVADIYARRKHGKDALNAYKRALASTNEDLEIDPNDGSSWMLMALFQCKVGDQTAARSSLRRAEDKNAIDIYSLVYKVRILELLERRDEALSLFATCLQMGATSNQMKCQNDLEGLRNDSRYVDLIRSIPGYQS